MFVLYLSIVSSDFSVLWQAYQVLSEMENMSHPLYRLRDCLPAEFTYSDMYWFARLRVSHFMRRALHALAAVVSNDRLCTDEVMTNVHSLTARVAQDARGFVRDVALALMHRLVVWRVDATVTRPARALLAPVRAEVAALPAPLQPLFSVDYVLDEVVAGIVRECLGRIVDAGMGKVCIALDTIGEQFPPS